MSFVDLRDDPKFRGRIARSWKRFPGGYESLARQPIAELFGFPPDSKTGQAARYRTNRLCPYNNKVPSCTKDSITDPLGVCTIFHGDKLAVICPIRLRQDWMIDAH